MGRQRRIKEKTGWYSFGKRSFKITLFLFLIGISLITFKTLKNWLSHNLLIKEIKVKGNKRVSAKEILKKAQIETGTPILSLDLKEKSHIIKSNPWIEEVKIQRGLPELVEIEILERKPVALIQLDDLYLVDRKGVIFKKAGQGEDLSLPLLTLLKENSRSLGNSTGEERWKDLIEEALKFLHFAKRRDIPVSKISIHPFQGLTIFIKPSQKNPLWDDLKDIPLRVGFGGFTEKFEKLRRIKTEIQGKKVKVIDLRYRQKVLVRLG